MNFKKVSFIIISCLIAQWYSPVLFASNSLAAGFYSTVDNSKNYTPIILKKDDHNNWLSSALPTLQINSNNTVGGLSCTGNTWWP